MKRPRPRYEIVHHSWKARPWVVIWLSGFAAWEIVSHHATEESAKAKIRRLQDQ